MATAAKQAANDAPEQNKNLAIWDALSKTDPSHTKGFSRAGGFKGTAIKPIWIVRRLTEQFGACGVGWGIDEPKFEVVPTGGEVLVFCTVSCWHGLPSNRLYGVGGDRAVAKNKNGLFCDDEAFKKAFTDAVGNAFKFIGVGADVHMGLFDDNKYVADLRAEFDGDGKDEEPAAITDEQRDMILALAPGAGKTPKDLCDAYKIKSLKELSFSQAEKLIARLRAVAGQKEAA